MCFKTLPNEDRPYSTEVFLDTSIHCCKLKGPLFVPRVDRVLAIFKWRATCTYTQVEYGNVVLSAAQYLLRKINDYGSLAKAKDFVGNRLPHGLHSGKVTWTFNLLREVYGMRASIDAVKPGMPVFEVSAKTGWGMDAWIEYLVERIDEKKAEDTPARAD